MTVPLGKVYNLNDPLEKCEKVMKILEDSHPQDEPVIISLEAYRRANSVANDKPPEPPDDNDPKFDEVFWAGRNHAMRRSARWVA